MKKLFFIIAGATLLFAAGCRQQDEFSAEENENLQLLKKTRTMASDSVSAPASFSRDTTIDGDPAPPPIK